MSGEGGLILCESELAIVVNDPEKYGARFNELIYEHRSHSSIRFFDSEADVQ